jgi:hypothetical protein
MVGIYFEFFIEMSMSAVSQRVSNFLKIYFLTSQNFPSTTKNQESQKPEKNSFKRKEKSSDKIKRKSQL